MIFLYIYFFKQSVCCLFLQGTTGAPVTDTHADDVIRQCCCCDSQLLMEIKIALVRLCRTVGGIWRTGRDEEGVWGYRDHTQVSTVQLAVCHCKVTLWNVRTVQHAVGHCTVTLWKLVTAQWRYEMATHSFSQQNGFFLEHRSVTGYWCCSLTHIEVGLLVHWPDISAWHTLMWGY